MASKSLYHPVHFESDAIYQPSNNIVDVLGKVDRGYFSLNLSIICL